MFRDRVDAGRHLALVVRAAGLGGGRTVVLGLPRGGVPVAAEVSVALGAPLDVIVVRKLGVPFQPELAMGAIGEDGVRVENEEIVGSSGVSAVDLEAIEQWEREELNRRAQRYREGRTRLDLQGRCAVIVDDGIATGSTARAACRVAHALGAVADSPCCPCRAESDRGSAPGRLRRRAVRRAPRSVHRCGRVLWRLLADNR